MWITKTCKMCGMEFEGKTNACYCSGTCRREYQTEYARRWRNRNREKYRKYMREYSKTGSSIDA